MSPDEKTDARAADFIVRRHDTIERICRKHSRSDPSMHCDLVQEANISVMDLLRRKPDAPEALIVHHVAEKVQSAAVEQRWTGHGRRGGELRDPLRRRSVYDVDSIDAYPTGMEWAGASSKDALVDEVVEMVEREERAAEVRAEIALLPENQQGPILLHYWQGMSSRTAGQWLGELSRNVRYRRARAEKQLAFRLQHLAEAA